jgi:membrane-associated phospholipid phosphatase
MDIPAATPLDAGRRGPSEDHPLLPPALRLGAGFVVVTAVVVAFGLLVTHPLAHSVGRWDDHVSHWAVAHRDRPLSRVTLLVTDVANTLPTIAIAAVAVGVLCLLRLFRAAWFIALALAFEVLSFLTTTVLVPRDRPPVPHLDAAPPTSSYPSGHTAAATVLAVGLALVVTWYVGRALVRAAAWTLAVLYPIVVAVGRVYRGMHHPTDVIAGALLGFAALAVSVAAVHSYRARAGSLRDEPVEADREARDRPAAVWQVPRHA